MDVCKLYVYPIDRYSTVKFHVRVKGISVCDVMPGLYNDLDT